MTLPSNGITPDVIREMMPPYHFSPDLLEATFAALPPPPPDASAAWRQARITRLMQEISTLMPADAAQARTAAQILIVRELADTIAARAYAPELTVPQMCRVGRAAADLVRTAAGLERGLKRSQQAPAPFFGTVLADEVDVAAVDAAWCAPRVPRAAEGAVGEPEDPAAGKAVAGAAGAASGTGARRRVLPAATIGARAAVTIGTVEINADLDPMNRESAPEATAAQAVGVAA
jgi:hypothetical protein